MHNQMLTYTIGIFGITFIFKGHFMNIFIFLFGLFSVLMFIDVYTRMRIERKRSGTSSHKGREGITAKAQILATMFFVAILVYFIIGIFDSTTISYSASGILTGIMMLYVMYEFISILENQLEYAALNNVKVNPVTKLLSNIFGLAYDKLEERILKETNEKIK